MLSPEHQEMRDCFWNFYFIWFKLCFGDIIIVADIDKVTVLFVPEVLKRFYSTYIQII